jgi:hypothetical protein
LNLENKRDSLQGNCQILSFQSISMSKIIWYMAYIIDDVSWVLEFLTCGYNISLVLSKKNEWSSRKLLYFVNWQNFKVNFQCQKLYTLSIKE